MAGKRLGTCEPGASWAESSVAIPRHPQHLRRLAALVKRRADRERDRAEHARDAAASERRPEVAAGLMTLARVHTDAETFYRQQASRFESQAGRAEPRRAALRLVGDGATPFGDGR
jgi:hypothetical protein